MLLVLSFLTLQGRLRFLTSAALAFSALGDVLLAVKFEHDFLNGQNFIAGLGAFLTAHLFYILVFLTFVNVSNKPRKLLLCASVLLYCVLLGTQILPNDAILKTAVLIYILVLSIMCFTAIFTAKQKNNLQVAGALIFAISDSIIAWDAFREPVPFASVWIMVTYYLAQAMIVLGIYQLNDNPELTT